MCLEIDIENKVRHLIETRILNSHKNLYMMKSKDVTDIIVCRNGNKPAIFFIEIKHWSVTNGRIGFGKSHDVSFQPEILINAPTIFENNMRWIFVDENSNKYNILTNEQCRKAACGTEISYKKQNNFNPNIVFRKTEEYSEDELIEYLIAFFEK